MALRDGNRQKLETLLNETPDVRIVLKPYAPPAALGLAGFGASPTSRPHSELLALTYLIVQLARLSSPVCGSQAGGETETVQVRPRPKNRACPRPDAQARTGVFFPFVMMFGGLAQFLAGMWGFVARDTLVTLRFSWRSSN